MKKMAAPISLKDCTSDRQKEIDEAAEMAIEYLMNSIPHVCTLHLKRLSEAINQKADTLILFDRDKQKP